MALLLTNADARQLLEMQDGLISRSQALDAGLTPTVIARLVRRRLWTQVHPGVYVEHTGPLGWRQRAWAAVLATAPAALDGRSAIRAHEGPGRRDHDDAGPIEVVVDHRRRVRAPAGVVVRRSRRFAEAVQANLSPPRMRYDEALLDLADRARDDLAAIALLADACGSRRTTAMRLLGVAEAMPRLRRRNWLTAVLSDVAAGTCSVLEHGYLTLVERAHGLPTALRQVAAVSPEGRPMLRDVQYRGRRPAWCQNVELDGRLFHASAAARDRDLARDLDAAVNGQDTVRIGYRQVFGEACRTARQMSLVLQRRGWGGQAHPCPGCPAELDWGTSDQAG